MTLAKLRLLLIEISALASAAPILGGCGQTCSPEYTEHDAGFTVPPFAGGALGDGHDYIGLPDGGYERVELLADGGLQLAPDSGALAAWLGAPCEEACTALTWGVGRSTSCRPAEQEADGLTYIHCDVYHARECTHSDGLNGWGGGRRPLGFVQRAPASSNLGAFFAMMAELEDASVPAFRTLKRDLRALGAPRHLVHAASRSARDEIRHARRMGALARRHGARAEPAAVPSRGPASLESLAVENAVEGCVQETFGALVATWSASHARSAEHRAAFARVARDETRHANLAWQIATWAEERMDSAMRSRVQHAREREVARLRRSLGSQVDPGLVAAGLVPPAAAAAEMIDLLESKLWKRGLRGQWPAMTFG